MEGDDEHCARLRLAGRGCMDIIDVLCALFLVVAAATFFSLCTLVVVAVVIYYGGMLC